jgi:hypothetical protein
MIYSDAGTLALSLSRYAGFVRIHKITSVPVTPSFTGTYIWCGNWYQCINVIPVLLREVFPAGQLHNHSLVPVPQYDTANTPVVFAWNLASRSVMRTPGPGFGPVPFCSTETNSAAWKLCSLPHCVQENFEWYPELHFDRFLPHGF